MKQYNISGLRGVIGEELYPEVLLRNVDAFLTFLRGYTETGASGMAHSVTSSVIRNVTPGGSGQLPEAPSADKGRDDPVRKKLRIVMGRDARGSGEAIARLIAGYVAMCGCDVDDIGILPTPTLLFIVGDGKYDGGIMVTASHNPLKYNALKFVKRGGFFLNAGDVTVLNDLLSRRTVVENDDARPGTLAHTYPSFDKMGKIAFRDDAGTKHIEKALAAFDERKIAAAGLSVAVDYCNSTSANLFPKLFARLGIKSAALFDSITGSFAREPEPNASTMKHLAEKMKNGAFDVGFVFDPDADRVAVLFENGDIPSEEFTLALAYLHYCRHKGGGDVAVNLSTSTMVRQVASEYGGKVWYAPVGEINVTEEMKARGTLFGGEGNGGVIYFPVSNSRDTVVAVLFILELLVTEKRKLSEIAAYFSGYAWIKEKIDVGTTPFSDKIDTIEKKFRGSYVGEITGVSKTDGIRIDVEGGFVHIRPSNTEPIVRVIIEGRNGLEKKLQLFVQGHIRELLS